jgi:hypothetical protein
MRKRQFFEAYRGDKKVSPLVTQLPWTHHLIILSLRTVCRRFITEPVMNLTPEDGPTPRPSEQPTFFPPPASRVYSANCSVSEDGSRHGRVAPGNEPGATLDSVLCDDHPA